MAMLSCGEVTAKKIADYTEAKVKGAKYSYKMNVSQIFNKIISTHLLTVLTIWCITQIVNRKRNK